MITIPVKHLSTFKEATIGLIHSKVAYPVYFQTRYGIHTFGMKFPIDVLILNDDFIVTRIKKLSCNAIFFWPPIYRHVIELPENYIQSNTIAIGDKVTVLCV